MFPNTIASGINGVDTFLPIDKIIYFPIISQTPTLWACFVVLVFASLSRTEAPCFSIYALLQAQGITGLLCFPEAASHVVCTPVVSGFCRTGAGR